MSTKSQSKGDSRTRQIDRINNYVIEHNLELVNTIDDIPLEDIGVSGYHGKNSKDGVLAIFLAALEDNKIEKGSVLLIESFDRLSRDNVLDAFGQFTMIINHGIEIVTLLDKQSFTKEHIKKDQFAIFGSLCVMIRANEESETKSKRLTSAWDNKRSKTSSKVLTSLCPAWLEYNKEKQEFEPIEERVKIVKSIFDMCINSYGMYSIARNLNENKVPLFGKGEFWHKSYITKILHNRSVVGEFQPHMLVKGKRVKTGDPIFDYFPKIIDEATLLLANVSIARRTSIVTGPKGINFTNIFAGLIYCGSCGSKMALRNHGGTDRSSKRLICNNQLVHASCQMSEWNLADFEAIIFRHLKDINFTDLMDNNQDDKIISLDDQKLVLCEKLKSNEQQIDRAMDLMVESDLSPEVKQRYQSKINNLDSDAKNIQRQIDDLSKQIIDKMENESVFSTTALKEMINELKNRHDDYEFRSRVNSFLTRAIEKFELMDSKEVFQPWELDENDSVIKSYRHTFPIRTTRSLDEIVGSDDFKQFFRRYYREIKIQYKTGAVRNILYGMNISFGSAEILKLFSKVKPLQQTQ